MSTCKVEVKDFICTVTFKRPPVNSTNEESYNEIRDTFHALNNRKDIKVVVFTGEGKVFMAGNDMDEFYKFSEPSMCTDYYDTIRNAYLSVKNCPYPVIGAINGTAAGAGFAFAACCDVLIAAEDAKFILPEIKVGIIGADGFASMMLPEKVLRYMAFSGNGLSAEQIAKWGGIWKVVPKSQVLNEAYVLADEFAQNARRALILWKQCLNENYDHELAKKFHNNLQATISYQPYNDFQEASAAFIEKRLPEYDNR